MFNALTSNHCCLNLYPPTPPTNPVNNLTCHWSRPQYQTSQWLHLQRLGAFPGNKTRPHASALSLTNSWSLYVGYAGIALLLQTQTILPQLMFWSTMCRLKSLNYMARQIKVDHRIWSSQVGWDSPRRTSQKSWCFPSKHRGITLLYYAFLSLYTDVVSLLDLYNTVGHFNR